MSALRVFLLFALLVPCWVIALHGVGDIGMYYSVAQYAQAGQFEKIYGMNAGVGHFFYGPLSLVFFKWMPYLSYEHVRIAWIVLQTFAYIAFWRGLHRLFPLLLEKRNFAFWLFIWVASIKSIHASFQSHNVQVIIAAILIWGEVSRLKGSKWAKRVSSWGSVLAGEVKVFPMFVALFSFVRERRDFRIGAIVAGLFGMVLPFACFGGDAYKLYAVFLENLKNFHDYAPLTSDAVTLSLASASATWLSPWLGMDGAALVNKSVGLVIAMAFLIFIWLTRKNQNSRFQTQTFALGLALMTFINSSTRPDYFIFFIPAFAVLAEMWSEKALGLAAKAACLGAFALMNLISEWTLGSRELGHQLELLRLPVLGMIMLCVAAACAIQKWRTMRSASNII